MKILCVSDQIDPLVYSASVRDRYRDVDLVLAAGDLPMEYIDFIVSSLNKPVYFVFGNHNLSEFSRYHPNAAGDELPAQGFAESRRSTADGHGAIYLGFRARREGKLLLAGLSGSLRYNRGLNQYTDRQMRWRIYALVPRLILNRIRYGRYLDILVTHAPPAGIHDKDDPCHRGFKCLLWFMRRFKPAYLVHGHIHLYDLQDVRVSRYLGTTVVNAYSHYLIETGTGTQ